MIKRLKKILTWVQVKTQSRVIKKAIQLPSWIPKFRWYVYGSAALALLFLIVESGMHWQLPRPLLIASKILDYTVFVLFLLDAGIVFYYTYPRIQYFKTNWMDFFVILPMIFSALPVQASAGLVIIRHVIVLIKLFSRSRKLSKLLTGVRLNTARIVVLSFIGTIFLGTLLLTFPAATIDNQGADFLDALFTATSATCVTGLIVQDTPTYFSTFGQVVILILIQIGGLGIMTYSAFIALVIGRLSFSRRQMMQEMFDEDSNVLGMIFFIFKMTVSIEAVGALLLFSRWYFVFHDISRALYFSIFHSISAFCNAGFALYTDSLMSFPGDIVINITVMSLIILGGIGFMVIWDCSKLKRLFTFQITTHSKVVILTSAALIVLGFFAIFFFEFDNVLLPYTIPQKVWTSVFQSVTTRTAGFNTIDIGMLKPLTLTLMIGLMFIGASPGSTGGGIKTSTFAILFLNVRAHLRSNDRIDINKRTVPNTAINKAFALFTLAVLLVASVFCLLLVTEDLPYLNLLFETVSAFATVGLSTGITAQLSVIGKLLIILLMYLGRIGPLTFGLAMTRTLTTSRIAYPKARLYIG